MELPGSAYLYTLATLSMTFAGFCAVVIVLCQTIGREISGFHVVLMRLYIALRTGSFPRGRGRLIDEIGSEIFFGSLC
jgi:hypothetical protein